jgi:serine/threonine-protein kinase
MDDEDAYEQALNALLAGEAVQPVPRSEAGDLEPLAALRVLSAIGQVARAALFGPGASERPTITWGPLEIREEIGRGASGTVYRAWDTRLARDVALKLFDPDSVSADAALAEGRLLAQLRHPNIVTVYGVDTCSGVTGLWMELVQGDTLDDLVRRDGPFSVEDTLLAGIDLAGALTAVHAAGMLHRDVKARNVVRQRGGRLVLMDFGAGHGTHVPTSTRDGAGTPLYMAPEVLDGAPASLQNDIYGLGVLLYYLVSGAYPVSAPDLAALKAAHRAGVRRPFHAADSDVPPTARAAIDRACATDTAARFATAQELEGALALALRDVLAVRDRVVPEAVRRWRRWRRIVLTAAAAAIAVTLGSALAWSTTAGRGARRALGLQVPPRSPLYFPYGGGIGVIDGATVRIIDGSNEGPIALAVSERYGIRLMPGAPPWIAGAWFRLDGTPIPPVLDSAPGLCCYSDGTTDGRFNYALRQDSTLLEPIGSRPLARPAIHRFDLNWRNREPLFELGGSLEGVTSRAYAGIAYDGTADAFWVTTAAPGDMPQAEQWSRDGRKLASFAVVPGAVGIAVDPADGTLWVQRQVPNDHLLHFDNFDRTGNTVGTYSIPEPLRGVGGMGLEFAWPATK